ncbi:MAG: KamA family radical SAM protein [Desulfobulbaceae bacterium]|nr:MAG: KamA family radical SAM protein [Desulfobulbaceae bacterium]
MTLLTKLKNALSIDPTIEKIICGDHALDEKRFELRSHLANKLSEIFDHSDTIPPLEWVLCRDAIWVLRNIIARRSEDLAGYSVLEYLSRLVRDESPDDIAGLTPDFVEEISHLLKGISGKAGIYPDDPPSFLNLEGVDAARERSAYLSDMARQSERVMTGFYSGLDEELIRDRSRNKERIKSYFDVTDLEWDDWRWHTRNIIRNADTLRDLVGLSDDEYQAVSEARQNKIPFGITPYYLSLLDHENRKSYDTVVRSQVIPPSEYTSAMRINKQAENCSMDFMLERDTSPIEGITRRYPNIVILKPVLTCPQICVYCQRNWQIEDVYSDMAALSPEKLDAAINWIAETEEINEVLITGGDPLLLSDEQLDSLISRISEIKHVIRIRIGTRTPVTLPQRVTDALVRMITRYHVPGKREIILITHFEHTTEITPEAMAAVQKFRLFGVAVYNQLVFTFFNSRKFETAALRQQLRLIGVTPYYTFNTKGKEETDNYRVPIARLLQEQQEEARLLPGTVRTDEIVFNVPKLGKNYLRASQHRDIISILPDGRRVYEFHPWEKKLALVDTYVYTDVSIHDYLQRLETLGEDIGEYRTIWYYY